MPMRGLAISFLMMAVFLTVLHLVTNSSKSENEIDYSTFMQMLDEGKIAKVEISHDGTGNYYASMESKEPSAEKRSRNTCLLSPATSSAPTPT